MRLVELSPRWIHPDMFTFVCPRCRAIWLTCKRVPMDDQTQWDLFEKAFGKDWASMVVPARNDTKWTIAGDFASLSVVPSIDASASGHWHGYITAGAIC